MKHNVQLLNSNGFDMEDSDPVVSESESESDEDGDVKLSEPAKTAVYNKAGLLDKLGDICWPESVEWMHKLSLDIDQENEVSVNDDLNRELAFYTQALEGARRAFTKFQSKEVDLPFLRPIDYYAEMVKSDTHMEKVKSRILAEKRKMEEAEERRKARDNKKLAKEIQVQKQKERAKQKKDDIESVKNWRKQRKQSGFAADDKDGDLSLAFEDGKAFQRSNKKRPGVAPGDRSGGKGRLDGGKWNKGSDKKMKGRERKDSKYGFGGRKGMKKQNTAETTEDFRGYRQSNKKQKLRAK
ncbi:probable rRNA-processing protein EBP2 homolog [Salvia hispanica]|uniref:probable rRNA-processing protein EBP2 homolog n=1 Tax=Salvia hispanica TaxID=49212 RepID=UPI002009301C|nr:probable rRNA-processing protein EBP2 homolog [Salvia hispanica]XP_047958833.1 probable rRNA-processing protein EBP2 homolog [Salvia hispanica]